MACCVAAEATEVIAFDRPGPRALLASSPGMGELVLGCLLARRAWHEGSGHGVLRLIAQRECSRAFQVRDLLELNLVPLRVHDLDADPMADKILDWPAIPREEAPLLIRNDKVMVIATGARWRELGVPGEERYRGSGLYHAAMPADAERYRGEDVVVIGGGNSAGQAATHLAHHARSVRMVVRGRALSSTMSRYLVDRVEGSPRIEVMTETEVTALHGRTAVDGVTLRTREGERRVAVSAVFAMIGAQPCTEAVTGLLAVDPVGYLLCGPGAASCDGRLCWPLGDRPPTPAGDGPPRGLRGRRRPRGRRQPGCGRRGGTEPWRPASSTPSSTARRPR